MKIKRTPRSPGFTAERRLPTDDLTDIRNLHAIKDLLQEDPSSLIQSDSKRRRRITDLLVRPAHLSSKQVKQMLLARRSLSPHPSGQSLPTPLARDVAPRTTRDGKKYLQIATSSSMYECGNPSVYQVNHRQAVPGTDPPLGSLDNIDPYYLGITEEYPHLIIDDGRHRQKQDPGARTHHESPMPAMPVPYPNGPPEGEVSAADHLPKINDVGGLAERQTSPVSKARIYGPMASWSPVRQEAIGVDDRPFSPEVQAPAPLTLPARPKAQLTKTPRNSVEVSHEEIRTSPNQHGRRQVPSIQSTVNSVADDAQSEASVGIVSMAQSAEVVRPGYLNSSALKFPKPGPAPTGALPSLPEGLDSKSSLVHLPPVEIGVGQSPQHSPSNAISRSPGRRNRYWPLDDAVNEDTAKLLRMQTRSRPKPAPQLPITGPSPNSSVDEPCRIPLITDGTPQVQEQTEESWRELRAKSRKALKARDLNRIRIQDDNGHQSSDSSGLKTSNAHSKDVQASAAKMRESYSSPALLPGYQPDMTQAGAPDVAANRIKATTRPISQISPILVLADQKPIQLPCSDIPSTDPASHSLASHTQAKSRKQSHSKPSPQLPLPSLPSLPSSDEDSTKRRTTTPLNPNSSKRHSTARSTKSGRNASTHQASSFAVPDQTTHPIELSDLEARLSARIAELEKKNTMLLNAFIAVINTNAGLTASEQTSVSFSHGTGSNGELRLSGLSGGSGMRSSGTSGGYRTSAGELGRVTEGYAAGSRNGIGAVNGHGREREGERDGG